MRNETLLQFEARAAENYRKQKERKRERYQLARRLGFSVPEAQALSHSPEERIEILAKQRKS